MIPYVGHMHDYVPHNPVCRVSGHDFKAEEFKEFAPSCFSCYCHRCETKFALLNSGLDVWNPMYDAVVEAFAKLKPLKEAKDPRFNQPGFEAKRPKFDVEIPEEVLKYGPWDAKDGVKKTIIENGKVVE